MRLRRSTLARCVVVTGMAGFAALGGCAGDVVHERAAVRERGTEPAGTGEGLMLAEGMALMPHALDEARDLRLRSAN